LKILLLLNHNFGKDVQIRLAELSFPIFPLLKDTITEASEEPRCSAIRKV